MKNLHVRVVHKALKLVGAVFGVYELENVMDVLTQLFILILLLLILLNRHCQLVLQQL